MEEKLSECPIADPVIIGYSGRNVLLASKTDIDAGETNGPACLALDGGSYFSPTKPLQVWFKWINVTPKPPDDEPDDFVDQ